MAIDDVKLTGARIGPVVDSPLPEAKPAESPATSKAEIRDGERLPAAQTAIKNEDTKSLVLQKPGDGAPIEGGDSEEKELGFIRSAFEWLRKNVTKNPWVRAAVAIAGLLIPGLAFLSMLMLALDGILLLDKLIAGEKISLKDIFGFAAGAGAAAADPEVLLPLSQLAVAGYQVFERWLKKRTQQADLITNLAARDKGELKEHVAELRQRTESALARRADDAAGTSADHQLVDDLSTTIAALQQKESGLKAEEEADRFALRNMSAAVAEMIARLDRARPGWLERLWHNAKALTGLEPEPGGA